MCKQSICRCFIETHVYCWTNNFWMRSYMKVILAEWKEHRRRAKRRKRTRKGTKSPRTPKPPRNPKVRRKGGRRTDKQQRQLQLFHPPQQVRLGAKFVLQNVSMRGCWLCVDVPSSAIPTEPPTEPETYTDYVYPDIGKLLIESSTTCFNIIHIFMDSYCYNSEYVTYNSYHNYEPIKELQLCKCKLMLYY